MSVDLIAMVVALALGAAVVIVGLRRNLTEATRNGLPRFGGDAEGETVTLGLYRGEERPRRPLSPRQQRGLAALYLLLGLLQAVSAALSSDGRPLHAALAAAWVVIAAVCLRRARA